MTLCNDATSACAAEFFFGEAWRHRDFLYFFLGAFVGGGLVLDGALYPGRTGNAAALGSMPIAAQDAGRQATSQLIARASICQLERRVEARRAPIPPRSGERPKTWDDFGPLLDEWIEEASFALAYAAIAAIVGHRRRSDRHRRGDAGRRARASSALRVAAQIETLDRRGLSDVTIIAGAIGADARAIGGAALPLIKNFARDREVLFKDAPIGLG